VTCDFGKVGFLICFDSIFSDSCREQVKNGAQLIAVSTNDSWYKESVALKQHCAHSVMRAIENGVSIVRSANTGISMIISPKGQVLSSVDINRQGVAFAAVPLLSKMTLFTKIGDIIVFVGIAFILLYALYNKRK
jgi:apolipoprotein N-acyltransferase